MIDPATEPGVHVRAAAPGDAHAVLDLIRQFGFEPTLDTVTRRLTDRANSDADRALVATDDDGRVLGLVALHLVPLMAERAECYARTTIFVVDEHHRGRGVGHTLLTAAEREARAAGAMVLEVAAARHPERVAAHAFLQALGFEDTHDHAVRYQKPLT